MLGDMMVFPGGLPLSVLALQGRILFCAALLALSYPETVAAKSAEEKPQSSGTGFVVSRQGHILTNHHVVDDCPSARVLVDQQQKEVTILKLDKENDLALLRLPKPFPTVARFRQGRNIRAGDAIVVVGYPYHGLLALEANVTTGTVSALAGIKNDTRFLQIAAPVQPGNSGGPVLDKSGNVVGVVQSKLNAIAMAFISGDLPQNVNFAIKDLIARSFLDAEGVPYETAVSDRQLEAGEIGEQAKQFTLLIECYAESLETKKQRLAAERRAQAEQKEAERRAQAELKRKQEAARELARIQEQEERARIAKQRETERRAAEELEYQRKKELAEKEAAEKRAFKELIESAEIQEATQRVTRFREAERQEERWHEALRRGHQARLELALAQNSLRAARLEARRRASALDPKTVEEARRKGQAAHAVFPLMSQMLTRQLDEALAQVREVKALTPLPVTAGPSLMFKTPEQPSSKTHPYWAWVEALISAQWQPPAVVVRAPASVAYRFYRNGAVQGVAVRETSGDLLFDQAAVQAVLAAHYPPFPSNIAEESLDVVVLFPGPLKRAPVRMATCNGQECVSASPAFQLIQDYYNRGQYDIAVDGIYWFMRQFPNSPLMPQVYYWLGESYFHQKQYVRAMRAFNSVVTEYAGTDQAPRALYKLGLVAAETGDIVSSKRTLKRLVEEYPTSEEAKLAEIRLVELR